MVSRWPWHQFASSSSAHGQTGISSVVATSTTGVSTGGYCCVFLQGGEEALHRRVVPAVGEPAHAAGDPVPGQEELVVLAGVLAAPIGVGQQSLVGQATQLRPLRAATTK